MLTLLDGRLVHGNTLTAAVVVENIKAASNSMTSAQSVHGSTAPSSVFLTGPTSKVNMPSVWILRVFVPSRPFPSLREDVSGCYEIRSSKVGNRHLLSGGTKS